jgi:hypothetical protein
VANLRKGPFLPLHLYFRAPPTFDTSQSERWSGKHWRHMRYRYLRRRVLASVLWALSLRVWAQTSF